MNKKLLFVLSLLLAVLTGLTAQSSSFGGNTYYQEGERLQTAAKAAFDEGDYEKAEELGNQASEQFAIAEKYADVILYRYKSNSAKKLANAALTDYSYINKSRAYYKTAYDAEKKKYDETDPLIVAGKAADQAGDIDKALDNYKKAFDDYTTIRNNIYALRDKLQTAEKLILETVQMKEKAAKNIEMMKSLSLKVPNDLKDKYAEALALQEKAFKSEETAKSANSIDDEIAKYQKALNDYTLCAQTAGEVVDTIVNVNKQSDALKLLEYVKKRVKDAEAELADEDYSQQKADIEAYIAAAQKAYDEKSYNKSMDNSEKAVAILDKLGVGVIFPKYYRVQLIPQNNESLWAISSYPFVYNSGIYWPYIFMANQDKFKGRYPDLIYPGELFFIPSLGQETRDQEYSAENKYKKFIPSPSIPQNVLIVASGKIVSVDASALNVTVEVGGQNLAMKTSAQAAAALSSKAGTTVSFSYMKMTDGTLYLYKEN